MILFATSASTKSYSRRLPIMTTTGNLAAMFLNLFYFLYPVLDLVHSFPIKMIC